MRKISFVLLGACLSIFAFSAANAGNRHAKRTIAGEGSLNCFAAHGHGYVIEYIGVNQPSAHWIVQKVDLANPTKIELVSDNSVAFKSEGENKFKAPTKGNVEGPGSITITLKEEEGPFGLKRITGSANHSEPGTVSDPDQLNCAYEK